MPRTRAADNAYEIANRIRARQAKAAQEALEKVKAKRKEEAANRKRPPYYLTPEGDYPWM